MEDLRPQRQSCLQKEKKLLRHVTKTRIAFSLPVIHSEVLQENQELLMSTWLPVPEHVQYLEELIVCQRLDRP